MWAEQKMGKMNQGNGRAHKATENKFNSSNVPLSSLNKADYMLEWTAQ